MLLALRSLWIILRRESSCKYKSPRAIPFIMLRRLCQSSCTRIAESNKHGCKVQLVSFSTLLTGCGCPYRRTKNPLILFFFRKKKRIYSSRFFEVLESNQRERHPDFCSACIHRPAAFHFFRGSIPRVWQGFCVVVLQLNWLHSWTPLILDQKFLKAS